MTDEVFEVQFDQHDSFCNSQFLLARGDRSKLAKSQEAFMTYYEQPMKLRWDKPHTDTFVQTLKLRASLIREEAEETIEAIEHILGKIEDGADLTKEDATQLADGLGDLLYVTAGAGVALNIDIDGVYAEVHRSNMTKLDNDLKPVKREDGKVLKGPRFEKPDLIWYLPHELTGFDKE